MQMTKKQHDLLVEIADKHIAYLTANYRNVNSSGMNNLKKKNDLSMKLTIARQLKDKILHEVTIEG